MIATGCVLTTLKALCVITTIPRSGLSTSPGRSQQFGTNSQQLGCLSVDGCTVSTVSTWTSAPSQGDLSIEYWLTVDEISRSSACEPCHLIDKSTDYDYCSDNRLYCLVQTSHDLDDQIKNTGSHAKNQRAEATRSALHALTRHACDAFLTQSARS